MYRFGLRPKSDKYTDPMYIFWEPVEDMYTVVVLSKSDGIHASYLSNLYWYFPWFHELGFAWYGFGNPVEPVEPVEISLSYS